jgi:hypothetical protein
MCSRMRLKSSIHITRPYARKHRKPAEILDFDVNQILQPTRHCAKHPCSSSTKDVPTDSVYERLTSYIDCAGSPSVPRRSYSTHPRRGLISALYSSGWKVKISKISSPVYSKHYSGTVYARSPNSLEYKSPFYATHQDQYKSPFYGFHQDQHKAMKIRLILFVKLYTSSFNRHKSNPPVGTCRSITSNPVVDIQYDHHGLLLGAQ